MLGATLKNSFELNQSLRSNLHDISCSWYQIPKEIVDAEFTWGTKCSIEKDITSTFYNADNEKLEL